MAAHDDHVLELLQTFGFITQRDAVAARLAANGRGPVGELLEQGLIAQEDILRATAQSCGMDYLASIDEADEDALRVFSYADARRYRAIPLKKLPRYLRVAVADPFEWDALDVLRGFLKTEIEPVVVPLEEIERAIEKFYRQEVLDLEEVSSPCKEESNGDAPLIQMAHSIIVNAHRLQASDVHLEPMRGRARLRYRIDGALREMRDPPQRTAQALINRIKIMSRMDIAEKRLPQDGRMSIRVEDGAEIDLRVSTVPTIHGEAVVMRILDRKSLRLDLDELGFEERERGLMARVLSFSDGLFLVTGPTGCGKTTTLYACLQALNQSDRKIITVEDPVEYCLEGVNQSQTHAASGMTFAAALRSMLRQSPDVMMVGEIRDAETAGIAVNASLTGHLVLSTLHTNDACGAVARLADMDVKSFLTASSLRAVMAQRLVRKVCSFCAREHEPTEWERRALNLPTASGTIFREGAGCEYCSRSGYKGRTGIFEFFLSDDEFRALIYENAEMFALKRCARIQGMKTLREDGAKKAAAGITTAREVLAVTMDEPELCL
ncbi:MAG: GspE/PulE family protein [bacterium]